MFILNFDLEFSYITILKIDCFFKIPVVLKEAAGIFVFYNIARGFNRGLCLKLFIYLCEDLGFEFKI